MKARLLVFGLACIVLLAFKSDKPAYVLFGANGKQLTYKDMLAEALKADIVFFGEFHNNPISHWLQIELTKDMYKTKLGSLVLGAEMFETDDQLVLNEYLDGLISEKKFEADCRLWPNYKTDYKPLLGFAVDNGLCFIATNVPRRYAAVVYSGGFEALENLSDEARNNLPPFPIVYDSSLTGYCEMLSMEGMGHGSENLPKSQNLKDATMAYFILKNWSEGKTLLHFNGAYHSDNHEGIVWHVNDQYKGQKKKLKIVTITTVSQEDVEKLEKDNEGKADFIICVAENMTTTH